MSYNCPHCNKPAISVFKRFFLRRYMTFNCKSCGTQLRINQRYKLRGAIGVFIVWFVITLAASYFPFSTVVKVILYLMFLFAAISIYNLSIPFEEVEQVQEQDNKQDSKN